MDHRVAAAADIEPETLTRVEVAGTAICLARTASGEWCAVADTCSHEEYSLSEGDLFGMQVECPAHGSLFDLRTGEPDRLPAMSPIAVYPVVIRGGDVIVEL
jgi:3-phenylpropionate/trans-cinnamate dioxygenase ferredoxin component